MKLKSKGLYPVVCLMLFVMTFTTLTSNLAFGDIVNSAYLGTYYNTENNSAFITISTSSNPITVNTVYCCEKKFHIRGVGQTVGMSSGNFASNFDKVRKVNENGVQQGDAWFYNVALTGTYQTSGWLVKTTSITPTDDDTYIKK